jgi:hypothetical protein
MDRSWNLQRFADANTHAHSNTDTDTDTHPDANSYADTYSDTYADTYADTYSGARWIRVQSVQGHEHQHELEYVRDGHGSDWYGDSRRR